MAVGWGRWAERPWAQYSPEAVRTPRHPNFISSGLLTVYPVRNARPPSPAARRSASTVSPAVAVWLTHAHEADDPTSNEARDLHHRNAAAGYRNHQCIAFVVDAGLVQVGIEELAGLVHDFFDLSGDRAPIHVTIENAHEYRNSRQRLFAKAEFARRRCARHLAHAAVCRRHHQTVAHRRDARWVAEKIGTPDGGKSAKPAERAPQPEQDQTYQREGADERISFRRDRYHL